jgi:hypothetical protein
VKEQEMQTMEPARKLGALREDEITEARFDALIVPIMAELRKDGFKPGLRALNIRHALERHAGLSADMVGEWLREIEPDQILGHLSWLGRLSLGYARAQYRAQFGWGSFRPISESALVGWAKAAEHVRLDLPEDLLFRLTLAVSRVEGIEDPIPNLSARSATRIRVVCHQWRAQGCLLGTPYHVDLRAVGRAAGSWKISRRAHRGLASLVKCVTESGEFAPTGWKVTFESSHLQTTRRDWRDGREEFTSTQHTLEAGRVVDVQLCEGDPEPVKERDPVPLLPENSAFAGAPFHKLVAAIEHRKAIESLVKDASESGR